MRGAGVFLIFTLVSSLAAIALGGCRSEAATKSDASSIMAPTIRSGVGSRATPPANDATPAGSVPVPAFFSGDPGIQRVYQAGLGRQLSLAQSSNGYTLRLLWAYADPNRVVILYTLSGPDSSDQVSYEIEPTLHDPAGNALPVMGLGAVGTRRGVTQGWSSFDGSSLAGQDGQVDLTLRLDDVKREVPIPRPSRPPLAPGATPAVDLLPPPVDKVTMVPVSISLPFAVPFQPARLAEPNLTGTIQGSDVTLTRVVVAPSETRIYLRWLGATSRVAMTVNGVGVGESDDVGSSSWEPDNALGYDLGLLDSADRSDWTLTIQALGALFTPLTGNHVSSTFHFTVPASPNWTPLAPAPPHLQISQVIMKPRLPGGHTVTWEELVGAATVVGRRLAALNLARVYVEAQMSQQVLAEIPTTDDTSAIESVMTAPGDFALIVTAGQTLAPGTHVAMSAGTPQGTTPSTPYRTILTNADLLSASTIEANGAPAVELRLRPDAASRLHAAVGAHLSTPIAVLLDGRVLTTTITLPTPSDASGDSLSLTGLSADEARIVAAELSGGRLATPISVAGRAAEP